MPDSIREMMRVPGKHAVSDARSWRFGFFLLVEVTDDGTVHQLTKANTRDGTLDPAGWRDDAICVDDQFTDEEKEMLK